MSQDERCELCESCPDCGEDLCDNLMWVADGEELVCETCGCHYNPNTGEVLPKFTEADFDKLDDSIKEAQAWTPDTDCDGDHDEDPDEMTDAEMRKESM
jgi:transcription initiation factor TFIIIB Brf1 subunit/transcription initiation factor TFIIB